MKRRIFAIVIAVVIALCMTTATTAATSVAPTAAPTQGSTVLFGYTITYRITSGSSAVGASMDAVLTGTPNIPSDELHCSLSGLAYYYDSDNNMQSRPITGSGYTTYCSGVATLPTGESGPFFHAECDYYFCGSYVGKLAVTF